MKAWLENLVGPDYATALLWTIVALIVLLVLLVAIRVVRAVSVGTFVSGGRQRKTRLAVMDATAIDSHRRLVLVRRDDVEHLILIGGPTDVVVEQAIRMAAPARTARAGARAAAPPRRRTRPPGSSSDSAGPDPSCGPGARSGRPDAGAGSAGAAACPARPARPAAPCGCAGGAADAPGDDAAGGCRAPGPDGSAGAGRSRRRAAPGTRSVARPGNSRAEAGRRAARGADRAGGRIHRRGDEQAPARSRR